MEAAVLDADGLLVAGDFSYASGEEAARTLLDSPDPPTAIIVSNDQMALATLEVARSRGLEIPRHLPWSTFTKRPYVASTHPRRPRSAKRLPEPVPPAAA